jgi:predicted homoserine dehydrogenase-like protein
MIIVDNALRRREEEGNPIRVALIGSGYMGRGIARQLLTPIKGMRLVAISNRHVEGAAKVFRDSDLEPVECLDSLADLEASIEGGKPVVTDDPSLLCRAANVDVIIESTGQVEFGAHVSVMAIDHGKHLVLVNAELDATLGPILKRRADKAGVVLTNTDGDEPGVAMNLYRFVETIGYRPVMAGNIKGFYNPYRNPETQKGFAEKVGQNAAMIASFADGTKLSMETCIIANATGLRAGRRGMFGHKCEHVKDVVEHFSPEQLLEQGLVEFVLGAQPGTGAFVVGYNEDPVKQEYMQYFKMGNGPLYVFYTPFHLPQLQVAVTVGRAALFGDAAVTPIGAPVCDVVSVAKRDLEAGETLDELGGFSCYGMLENAEVSASDNLLPMGLAEGCRLKRSISKDAAISYADIELPAGRLCDLLRAEQNAHFALRRNSLPELSMPSIQTHTSTEIAS